VEQRCQAHQKDGDENAMEYPKRRDPRWKASRHSKKARRRVFPHLLILSLHLPGGYKPVGLAPSITEIIKSGVVGINAALNRNTSAVGIVDRSQTNKR
jgi:hypothetical protein